MMERGFILQHGRRMSIAGFRPKEVICPKVNVRYHVAHALERDGHRQRPRVMTPTPTRCHRRRQRYNLGCARE